MKGMHSCGAAQPGTGRETSGADGAFEPEAARQRLGVEPATFGRLFECVWEEVAQRRSLLDEAVAAGDIQRIALHAHTIKSSCAAIGAVGLSRAAEAVELAAGSGDQAGLARAMDAFHEAKDILSRLVGLTSFGVLEFI